ncbi:putative reverse transcriptase domain-containing protein [Tanacetum coccineum]
MVHPSCAIENQVKFATCTMLGAALTWWNCQIRTLGPDAYLMTWEVLKKKITDKYCPQGEIKKLEIFTSCGPKETSHYMAERQTDNKRKADDSSRNNHGHQQQPFKRHNVLRGSGNTNVANAQRNNRAVPKGNGCFECGAPGHFKRDCPKLKNKEESRLIIISCSKAQEYMAKGCQIFLAQISAKKEEDKLEGKQLKDVPIVQDFSEVFPEDLSGHPPA